MKKVLSIFVGISLLLSITQAFAEMETRNAIDPVTNSAYGAALPVKGVYANGSTSFLIDANDTLYAWGNISCLGAKTSNAAVPEKVSENVSSVSSSGGHTLIVKTDGSLWACGDNVYGQLGTGTAESSDTFIRIMDDVETAVTTGNGSFAIKKDNTLWMWGKKEYFLEKKEWSHWPENGNVLTPLYVTDDVKSLALGTGFALVLKRNGTLYIQGNYHYGLSINNKFETWFYELQPFMDGVQSVAAVDMYWLAVKSGGELWHHGTYASGLSLNSGTPEILMEHVQSVSVNDITYGSAFALQNDGTLWAWGKNGGGQLGDGTVNEHDTPFQVQKNVSQVAAGSNHAIVLKQDGSIWAWGNNSCGQLGNGYIYSKYTLSPNRIMEDVSEFDDNDYRLVRKTDGSIWTWGAYKNDSPPRMVANEIRKYYSLGYIQGSEANGYTEVNQFILKDDGSVWAWGKNDSGRIGDGTVIDRTEPVQVLGGVTALFVSDSGYSLNYALTQEGRIYQWGSITYPNNDGSVGGNPDNDVQILSPSPVPLENVKKLAVGNYYNENVLAITEDGTLWAWGNNDCGLVGNGKKVWQRQPAKILTDVEDAYIDNSAGTCVALKKDGTLFVWGGITNANGETKIQRKPKKILAGVIDYIANGECILAKKTDGSLWAWGYFPSGVTLTQARKIMEGDASLVPGAMSYILRGDGSLWELNLQTRKPYAIPKKILDNVAAVSEGITFYNKGTVLALTKDGGIWAWGANNNGSIGNGTASGKQDTPVKILDNGKAVKNLYDLSFAITRDGGFWVWGNWSSQHDNMNGLPICILP